MNENAVVIRDLKKSYGRRKAEVLKGLDMTVKKGSVYALLGLNGVGKTTSIRIMTGQLAPSSGTVLILGLDPFKNAVELKRKLAYVAEDQRLYDWMTLKDLIKFVRAFYPQWDEFACERLIKIFSLPDNCKIRDFSRGMYTKAALLTALCRKPEILILDDPTMGLDTAARRDFMSGLLEAIHEFERTVIFSTHIIPEIDGIADYAGILVDGRIVVENEIDKLKASLREVRMSPADVSRLPEIKSQLNRRERGGEMIITLRAGDAEINNLMNAADIKHFVISAMSLEDIFLALSKPLYAAGQTQNN